jgi:transposase
MATEPLPYQPVDLPAADESPSQQQPEQLTQEVHCNRCGHDFARDVERRRGVRTAVVVKICDFCRGRCASCLGEPQRNPIFRSQRCHVCYFSGKTFSPIRRVLHNGKLTMFHNSKKYGNNVPWNVAEKFGLIEASNEQPTIEDFYAVDHVKTAQETLSGMSVREIQQKWQVSARTAWEGKKAVLDLPLKEQEAAMIRELWKPDSGALTDSAKAPRSRKCDHGNWQHQDDRGGFSRHCTACNSHATSKHHVPLPEQAANQRPTDQELIKLYEAGDTPREIAKLTGVSTKLVRKYLKQAGVQLRPEDQKGSKVIHKLDAAATRYKKKRSAQQEIVEAGGDAVDDWDAPSMNPIE